MNTIVSIVLGILLAIGFSIWALHPEIVERYEEVIWDNLKKNIEIVVFGAILIIGGVIAWNMGQNTFLYIAPVVVLLYFIVKHWIRDEYNIVAVFMETFIYVGFPLIIFTGIAAIVLCILYFVVKVDVWIPPMWFTLVTSFGWSALFNLSFLAAYDWNSELSQIGNLPGWNDLYLGKREMIYQAEDKLSAIRRYRIGLFLLPIVICCVTFYLSYSGNSQNPMNMYRIILWSIGSGLFIADITLLMWWLFIRNSLKT